MNVEFVLAKAGDAVTISTLRQRIWDTTYRGIYPDTVIDDFNYEWHQQRDLKKISDPSFTVCLIKYGDEDIGYFVFQHSGSGVWLRTLYVLREYQHRGIGKQAFAILKDYCREKGIDGCYECDGLESCEKGFYIPANDGANAAKAQSLYIRKYGKKAFLAIQDRLHTKYQFEKVQEILRQDYREGFRILEEN